MTDESLTNQANEWIQWLNDTGKSEAFIKNAISTMRRFCVEYDQMNAINVNKFLNGVKPSTANAYLARFQSFCKYHQINIHKATRRRETKEEPIALNSNQLQCLIDTALKHDVKMANTIIVLAETGLRIHEFLQLNADSIFTLSDRKTQAISIKGKGSVMRTVPITAKCASAFRALQFPLKRQEQAICRGIAKIGELAEIPFPVTTHTLRRTFATIALNEKHMTLQDVMKVGGWSNPANLIKHYLRVDIGRISEAMSQ